jgi:hypothetical protein
MVQIPIESHSPMSFTVYLHVFCLNPYKTHQIIHVFVLYLQNIPMISLSICRPQVMGAAPGMFSEALVSSRAQSWWRYQVDDRARNVDRNCAARFHYFEKTQLTNLL